MTINIFITQLLVIRKVLLSHLQMNCAGFTKYSVIIEIGLVIVLFFTVEVRLYYTRAKKLSTKYANSPIAKVTLPPIFLFLINVCMQKHGPIGVVCLFLMHNIAPPTF